MMKQKILNIFIKYRLILLTLTFTVLLGYGLLRLQIINNPQADPDYVSSKQTSLQTDNIRVKDSLRDEINKLVDTPVNVQPDLLGRPDPFNP